MGKYLGLSLTLFVNMTIMLAVFLLTLGLYHVPIQPSIFQAVALIFVEIMVVTAIALFFSTFTSTTLSAIFTLGLYVIGHLTADLRTVVATSESGPIKSLIELLYYLSPNLEMLNLKGQAAVGVAAAPEYVMMAALYGFMYAGVLLIGACLIFQQRDF